MGEAGCGGERKATVLEEAGSGVRLRPRMSVIESRAGRVER